MIYRHTVALERKKRAGHLQKATSNSGLAYGQSRRKKELAVMLYFPFIEGLERIPNRKVPFAKTKSVFGSCRRTHPPAKLPRFGTRRSRLRRATCTGTSIADETAFNSSSTRQARHNSDSVSYGERDVTTSEEERDGGRLTVSTPRPLALRPPCRRLSPRRLRPIANPPHP